MLEIKFLNEDKRVITLFRRINPNVICVGDVNANTSGFTTYIDGELVGDFSNYTTIYKVEDNKVYFSKDGSVYDYEAERIENERLLQEIQNNLKAAEEAELRNEKMLTLLNALTITRTMSDKLGSDFLIYKLGEIEFKREYVESSNNYGTENNPIDFEIGISLITNAFYKYEDKLYVYVGNSKIADSTPVEDESFEPWY